MCVCVYKRDTRKERQKDNMKERKCKYKRRDTESRGERDEDTEREEK